jgi:hypothetical protein
MSSVNGPTGPRAQFPSAAVEQRQPARAQFSALMQQAARPAVGQGLGSGISGRSVIASALEGRSAAALNPYAQAFGAVAPESSGQQGQAPATPGAASPGEGTPGAPSEQQRAMMDVVIKMAISVMVNSIQSGFQAMSNQPKPELELEKG